MVDGIAIRNLAWLNSRIRDFGFDEKYETSLIEENCIVFVGRFRGQFSGANFRHRQSVRVHVKVEII